MLVCKLLKKSEKLLSSIFAFENYIDQLLIEEMEILDNRLASSVEALNTEVTVSYNHSCSQIQI